jgi:hypothetical protein
MYAFIQNLDDFLEDFSKPIKKYQKIDQKWSIWKFYLSVFDSLQKLMFVPFGLNPNCVALTKYCFEISCREGVSI